MNNSQTSTQANVGVFQIAILVLSILALAALAADTVWEFPPAVHSLIQFVKYPVTTEGRVVGIVLMICGVGMFAGLSGLVASVFLGGQDRKPVGTEEILARLDQLQAKLDRLSHEQGSAAGGDRSG